MAVLEVDGVFVRFGGIVALDNLSFDIDEGQICGLIGPNGAGKTTMFNCVSRIYQPTSGSIRFDGRDLLAVPAHGIAKLGIARTFQNLALWSGMNVLENVMVGAHTTSRTNWYRGALRLGVKREDDALTASAMSILRVLSLDHLALHPVTGLTYGTLKRVELARALASHPRLLLLDEPASGLTHAEVDDLARTIQRLRDEFRLTVLLVEHHMQMVMGISEKVVVLDFGRKIAEGTPDVVRDDPKVIEAYLGERGVSLLEVIGMRASYGQVRVLHGLDFSVDDGEIVVLLGANGAGKTTTLRAISQMDLVSVSGEVNFAGRSLVGMKPEAVVKLGIAHVPQGRGTFPELTVDENLAIGAYLRRDGETRSDAEKWYSFFPRLADRRHQKAGSLSGGEQQMLAVARALMTRPRLLLLDEPSLGLAPIIIQDLFRHFAEVNRELGTTMLVVEQNANVALSIASRGYVLETGEIVLGGEATELESDDAVRRAYLGF